MLLLFVFPVAYAAEEKTTSLQDQREVAVTIYNEGLALVKDARKIHLDQGDTALAWRDVSARIRPESWRAGYKAGHCGKPTDVAPTGVDAITPESTFVWIAVSAHAGEITGNSASSR